MQRALFAATWVCSTLTAHAAGITLTNTLGDHAVLQRDVNAVVWGFGDPGVSVITSAFGQKFTTTVGSDGVWRQSLPPQPATPAPQTLLFNASEGSSASLSDILFGDVYMAMGQSNMQFTVASAYNASAEIAAADSFSTAPLRVFTVGTGTFSNTSLQQLATVLQPWTSVSAASIGEGNWSAFSAVAWFTFRDLYLALLQRQPSAPVPIGIISNNWGGTPIQAWCSPDALWQCGTPMPPPLDTDADADAAATDAGAHGDPPTPSPYTNSTLYNAMVNPYIVGPMAMVGAIYYQAEANAPPFPTNATWYACQQTAMVTDWRLKFNNPGFYFALVQLAPFIGPDGWQQVRDAQLAITAVLPNTSFVSAVDGGEPQAPFGSYHPTHKQPIGARLAAVLLANVYGVPDVVYQGPRFASAAVSTVGTTATITVTFQPGTTAGGLLLRNASCPVDQGVPAAICQSFAVYATPGPSPPTPVYSYLGVGFLAAGDDVLSGTFTLAQAEAACNANASCVGITFASNSSNPTAAQLMYLKSAIDYSAAAGWQSYANDRVPGGLVSLPVTAAVAADGQSLQLTATLSSTAQQLVALQYAWSTWPVTPLYNGAGFPAIPFNYPLSSSTSSTSTSSL